MNDIDEQIDPNTDSKLWIKKNVRWIVVLLFIAFTLFGLLYLLQDGTQTAPFIYDIN